MAPCLIYFNNQMPGDGTRRPVSNKNRQMAFTNKPHRINANIGEILRGKLNEFY